MKQFIERLLQARQLVGHDLLAGLRFGLSRALLMTGIAVMTLALLLVCKQERQQAANGAVAGSFSDIGLIGTALAAEFAALRDDEHGYGFACCIVVGCASRQICRACQRTTSCRHVSGT
jgi:hypothetical protein